MNGGLKSVARKDWGLLGGALCASIFAGFTSSGRFGEVVAFLIAAVALSILAMVVGHATDHLGNKLSAGVTGVLQSAFGNLPELFICYFSLRAGLVEVVKGALVGSILANSLLVLGAAILCGGLKHGTQTFRSEPPKMIATLMMLATAALVIPSLVHWLHAPASMHEGSLSVAVAIVLLVVFVCSLVFTLKSDKAVTPPPDEFSHASVWPIWFATLVLVFAGVGAAFVSEWFVEALTPATKAMGISQGFSGLVIAAIAGNAIENIVGIQMAMRNKQDLALSLVLNSSLQIALLLIPLLVLISLTTGGAILTLVFSPLMVAALVLASLVTAFIVFDGESIWLEGVALIGLYVVIVIPFWWD
jgi:Ca2+:H+ antiporter